MPDNAIVIENLSKRYLIGHRLARQPAFKYAALRDIIGREIGDFARKSAGLLRGHQVVQGDEVEPFWALRDVSFDIKQGEVLGIVGRNGAGKSTLLKILSRITEPTAGRITLSGRVASLLEVGTGFHPELTGSENIFLNGAILGMTRVEIRRKFDEIVAFAGVEKFLDTPVKHYSSGMYVRLAFAVAAHLEPDILIVDEVLAVGDAEFQKKSLSKITEVSRKEGRTVLFVSHNMGAILRLCPRSLFLESGRVRAIGDTRNVVPAYLQNQSSSPRIVDLLSIARAKNFKGKARLAKVCPADKNSGWSLSFSQPLAVDLTIDVQSTETHVMLLVTIFSAQGFAVATWTNKSSDIELAVRPGINSFRLKFQHLRLLPGRYSLGIGVRDSHGGDDWIAEAVLFDVNSSVEAANLETESFEGVFIPCATIARLD
jgi:lipopolysaccharide transport system ATP-binding protein